MLRYNKARYTWLALWLCIGVIILYNLHDPYDGPNGGSWLGYCLGALGFSIILWLTWFGSRKHHYNSTIGTVSGWLSAHVNLGISLTVIVTLHTGFQFGWNVHTLAYVLMLMVIVSGVYGVFSYLYYPNLMTRNNADTGEVNQLYLLQELDKQSLVLADRIDGVTHDVVLHAVENTAIAKGVLCQLFMCHQDQWIAAAHTHAMDQLIHMMDEDISRNRDVRQLIDVLTQKQEVLHQVRREVMYKARMDIWLCFHVPLTYTLLGALITHVFSVFYYW